MLSRTTRYSIMMKLFGWATIPLVGFANPRFEKFDDKDCVVSIPLWWATKNHVRSMYFGALAIGAELSIAAAAVFLIQDEKLPVDFIFKDFKCEFLKRGDGRVHFYSHQVAEAKELIYEALKTPERLERKFQGYAKVPTSSDEVILKFELTMSVKARKKKT